MTNEFWIILSDVNNSIDFHHDLRAESMSYLSANILEICHKMEYKFKFRLIYKKKILLQISIILLQVRPMHSITDPLIKQKGIYNVHMQC